MVQSELKARSSKLKGTENLRAPAPMKTCLIWAVMILSLSLFLPLSVSGGTIRTSVTTTQTVTDQGAIELECRIRNNGDAMAHKVAVTLVLGNIVKTYDRLGDNPAGGEIRFRKMIANPGLSPGKYVAVLRVKFEEQTGNAHHAYHFFEIPYRTQGIQNSTVPLSIKSTDPCFNKKAFWAREGIIRLLVKNDGREEIRLNAWLFLPEGFSSPTPNWKFRLSSGETKIVEIPLRLEPDGTGNSESPYRLIVWCDHGGAHYSWDIKGTVTVVERPVYFKAYLLLGSLLLMLIFAVLLFHKPKPPGAESPNRSDNDPIPDNS